MIHREIPPTAGLPLRWSDFFGAPPDPLENGLAKFIGVPEVQIECSGTASLIVALETLKRRSPRRTVVIPAFNCPLVPLAIRHCGLNIRLCDIQPDRFDPDPDSLRECVDSDTLCIVPAHLAGTAVDLDAVLDIAKQAGAFVIEDAAQALGATRSGRSVGTSGDIGFFSLACGKGLTSYEGGVLIARDPVLRAALRETGREIIRSHRGMEFLRFAQLLFYRIFYNPTGLGLTNGAHGLLWLARSRSGSAGGSEGPSDIPLHAVGTTRKNVAARALPRLRDAIEQNAVRARERIARLENLIPGLTIIRDLPGSSGTWPHIMLAFRDRKKCAAVLDALWDSGLGVGKLFVHDLRGYEQLKSILPSALTPNARSFAARHQTITNSPWLGEAGFEQILAALRGLSRI